MRRVSDAQVRRLMEEMNKDGQIGRAAMKADMDRKTARKYVKAGRMPSEMKEARNWRTRQDPFEDAWPMIEERLQEAPELEAKTLFEELMDTHPEKYQAGQLRTLQRRVRQWRALRGPDRRVMLAQEHRPGEAAQTDFTDASELGVTIAGEAFTHLLCVFVLPFSNWRWATVCLSESIAALRRGVQRALFRLGRVPQYHQTDNTTAATHNLPKGKEAKEGGRKRPFNEDYLAVMRHFGMTPRTTEVGQKEQNGDVEAANRATKRKLEQALLRRGSRDFATVDDWQAFVDNVQAKTNKTRGDRVAVEMAAMRELSAGKLPEFEELAVPVSEWGTIRVKHCAYSVPSRLIGHEVTIRVYADRIEVYYANVLQLACERLLGRNRRRIDYRHIIWSLVRKPGGFARYVYREEMFPSPMFRRAYDGIQTSKPGVAGDLEYLRILHLAASTYEADVDAALAIMLEEGVAITADAVKELTTDPEAADVPQLEVPAVELQSYDDLLKAAAA